MALCQTSVMKIYSSVIEDVILGVRDSFLDEGVDEQVLQEMKNLWRNKINQSKAVDANPEPIDLQPPAIVANNPKPSKAAQAKAKKAAAAAAAAAQHQTQHNVGSSMNNHNNNINNNNNNNNNNGLKNGFTKITGQQGTSIGSSSSLNPHLAPLTSTNPPPLTPTSQATLLAQQRSSYSSNNSSTTSATSGPYVQSLDPNRVMPVNITLPAQAGVANAETRVLTIHVPASALQENHLTQILSAHLISSIMSLPPTLASSVLQQHVNAALMQKNLTISKQLDGAVDIPEHEEKFPHIASNLKTPAIKEIPTKVDIIHKTTANVENVDLKNEITAKNDEKLLRGLIPLCVQVDGGNITSDEEVSEDSDENLDNDDDDDLDKDDDIDDENVGAEEEPLNSEDDVTDEESTDLFDTDNVIVCQYDKITRSRNKWKFYLKDGIINICGKDYVFQRAHGDAEW